MQKIISNLSLSYLGGILVTLISLVAYFITFAPTLSFWDCGEFIACANGLQVGHAPGAPLYLMITRVLSAFAPPQYVAYIINLFSAIASALTILLLYSSLVMLINKLSQQKNTIPNIIAALIGALTFAFTDSFWFSAVEAEVYALSLFFTAFTMWAVLKWELEYPQKFASRWLLLIVFCLGLSVGVHLLNLLAIPVVFYWVYIHIKAQQKNKHLIGITLGFILLILVQFVIIQNGLVLAKHLELFLVNKFKLHVHSGLVTFVFVVLGLFAVGTLYFRKRNSLAHFAFASLLFFTIGLLSYAMVIIRANAQTGINLNNPTQVFSLESFINREQYGQRPLLKGAWFGARRKSIKPAFSHRLNTNGQYEKYSKGGEITYYPEDKAWLQRMYSPQPHHINGYQFWSGLEEGEKPTLMHQLEYMFKYQLGHMYLRYFMWNFSGRQNHYQGHGDFLNGNYTTGLPFIDKYSLGSRNYLHAKELTSPARNNYFMLPFLLGLLGILGLVRQKRWDLLMLMGSLFVLTGVAIVFYSNQPPIEPRERDYVFVGSFYTFCFFIGFAVWGILKKVREVSGSLFTMILTALFLTLALPGILFAHNYNDHNRSDRTLALDLAKSYLKSCAPNAILFTYGDNDTYPLWYIQEVEEFRTDIRVINLGLLSADWYIRQQIIEQKGRQPLSFTIPIERYRRGDIDYAAVIEGTNKIKSLQSALYFLGDTSSTSKIVTSEGNKIDFITSEQLILDKDSTASLKLTKSYLMKGEIALLDIISSNFSNRPIYFANGTPKSAMLGLDEYIQPYGIVGKLNWQEKETSTMELYHLLMNQIKISIPEKSWWDETGTNAVQLSRLHFTNIQLAKQLWKGGKTKQAQYLLKKYYPISMLSVNSNYKDAQGWIQALYSCGLKAEAIECIDRVSQVSIQNFNYYLDSQQYLGDNMLAYAKEEEKYLQQLMVLANKIEAYEISAYIQTIIH